MMEAPFNSLILVGERYAGMERLLLTGGQRLRAGARKHLGKVEYEAD